MKLKNQLYILIILAMILAACAPQATRTEEVNPTVEPASQISEANVEAPAEAPSQATTLQIIGPWRASEADAFEDVLDGFRKSTGINVVYEGVDDVLGPLTTRVAAGTPPDLAILPVAKGLLDLHSQNALIPLDPFMDEIKANFSAGWIDQFTLDGQVYAIPMRANINNCFWFNPEVVGTPPTSWPAFTSYCDSVAADGMSCTAGLGKDTWTLNVLFQSIYIATHGLEKYNAMTSGEIPLNDPSVVEVFNRITTFYGDKYVAGGSVGALGTGLVDGIALVFGTNPTAQFVNAGSWANGIAVGAVNENLVEGETIDYILFPGESVGEGAIIAAADVAVMLVDSPEARQLMSYLISAEGQALFAPNGYTVANKNVDSALYSGLAVKTARLLAESAVGPDISAVMTNEVVSLINEAVAAAILSPDNVQAILDDLQANSGK